MEVFTTLHEQYPLGETLIVVALFLAGIWIVEHVLYKVVKRIGRNENNPLPSSSIFANIVRVCVWAIGLAWMFRTCFNYDVTGFVAALGIGGIAISWLPGHAAQPYRRFAGVNRAVGGTRRVHRSAGSERPRDRHHVAAHHHRGFGRRRAHHPQFVDEQEFAREHRRIRRSPRALPHPGGNRSGCVYPGSGGDAAERPRGSWARWGYACASTASNSAVLRAISWSMCSGML